MGYNKKSLKNLDRTSHGMSGTRFYRIYCHIWNRCNREKNSNYKNYGGRGIKNEWNSFEEFVSDMHESYNKMSDDIGEKNVSIDRVDNNGNYCKDNCRWIHISKQQSNRGINNYLTYKGKTMCIREWSKEIGIGENTLRQRVLRGRDTKKALETPIKNNFGNPEPKKVLYNGKKYTVKELVEILPYSKETIYRKIRNGTLENP